MLLRQRPRFGGHRALSERARLEWEAFETGASEAELDVAMEKLDVWLEEYYDNQRLRAKHLCALYRVCGWS